VLLSMDETTYDAGSNKMGYDHPISWCKPYDGGRVWVTGMGHFGAHYDEPDFLANIVGGVKYAAGMEPGDCGGTINSSFEKVTLDDNTSAPFALDVAPDGRVFFTELVRGQIRVYDPATETVKTALTLDVYSGGEDGLLGIAVDPNFEDTGYVYVYYAPDSADNADPANFFSQVSRFTIDESSNIDPASEKLIIKVPASREPDEPGHTGGGLDFDLDGNLLLSVGDDVNPHSEPSGGYAPLSERDGTFHDARATSANSNDLRGKLLRVTPGADGGYTIPAGNLFDEAADTSGKTRPEIYAMGFRNPFRFSVDPKTGWIGLADYAPDSGTDRPDDRGPAGIVEWNLIKSPGNYGWPLCMGDNEPFRDVDYRTSPVTVGDYFDCANPINDSVKNTGLTQLPPARAPIMYYGYTTSSVPAVIPAGGGLAPMGGPFYDYDPSLVSDVKFPEYFDGKPFFYEWSKNRIYSMLLDDAGTKLEKISRFLPTESFLSPQDMKFGPDGALYTLEWGGGFGRDNPNSGIYRVDYINGSRSPIATATATPDNGSTPLTVSFDGSASRDPEGEPLTYAWDFDGNGTTDATTPTATNVYSTPGAYSARLTVTDPAGKSGTTVLSISVGNSRPQVSFNGPVNGGFIDWGDTVAWDVSVTDPDGGVDPANIIVQPALGHDTHPHSTVAQNGPTGSVVTDLGGGHSEDMNVRFILDARYTDAGAPGGVPPLTGSSTVVLQPKHKEAEHAEKSLGAEAGAIAGDVNGGGGAGLIGLNAGDWAAYEPVNLTGVDSLSFRVASSAAGGGIELHKDSPTGELLGSAAVPNTGGPQRWSDVTIDTPESTATMSLYVVFTGTANFRVNFWEVNGKGLSATTRPQVQITAPTDMQALEPGTSTLTATATDAENDVTSVEFFVDGQSVGTDNTAPYSVDWTETEEDYYVVHAVATNSAGLSKASRKVRFTVGEFGVRPPWTTFGNTTPDATFDQLGSNFKVSAAGSDVWQGTNQYGAVFLPGGTPENFEAVVKVASFDGTHAASKAGIMVRNDITQANDSPGYMVFSEKGNGDTEFMHDAGGNGHVNDTGEPVATGCGAGSEPNWLKVQKKNKVFTVWCSRNGTDWTQVGAPTLIPSAAAVQDIGLFVVSHIAGTLATAEFSNWELKEIDGGTDPEPEDPAPSCAQLKSDEFDGSAVDAARWTTVRGTPTVGGGSVTLPITNGDIDGANQGAISYLGQPAPTGSWQATTKVTLEQDNEWQYAGLLLHVDDDNYSKVTFTKHSNDSRFFEFWSETGGSRTGHGSNVQVPAATGTTVYVRLAADGTQLTASYSLDGETFTPIGTGPLKTGAKIGPVAAGDVDAQNKTAAFDWFRITPDEPPADPGFDDEFDGDALDGCRWDKIKGWKSSNLELADGKLGITTFDADISGANNGPVQNLILQTPPPGDWTVETKMTAPLKDNWQLAGFMLHADDDHYVKYDVVADNAPGETPVRRVELRYENGGNLTGPSDVGPDLPPPASATDTWWLRLTKIGNTYTGQISADGETWVDTPGSVTVELTNPGLGVMAMGPSQSDGPIDVTFDYIRAEEANAAPVIDTATATPTSGFAPLDVAFAASATDANGDELSYSWDFDGDGTEDADTRNAAHTYTQAGTHAAELTVSDGEATATRTIPISVLGAAEPGKRFRALVFSKTAGFRHSSIDEGIAAIRALGSEHDFQVDATEDATAFRPGVLSEFDTVVFLSTTGDVLSLPQQAAFEDYVRAGGGYAGVHAASDTEYGWRWYGNLVGAYFRNHPANQTADVHVEDQDHPSTAGLPAVFPKLDEWYNFKAPAFAEVGEADFSPRSSVHVLARVDEATYDESDGNATDDDHPVTWCQRYDGGRSWYTAMGHTEASYTEAEFLRQVLGGLETTAGVEQSQTCGAWDAAAPDTDAALAPQTPASGWHAGPVKVTLTANDGADGVGVATTEYRIDGGAWTAYGAPFEVTGDGHHTVDYRSTDRNGNAEEAETITVKVDTVAPRTTATLDPARPDKKDGTYKVPVRVTLSGADDAGSGVAGTEYRVDGGAWTAYAAPFTLSRNGTHVVEYRSTDRAGNVEPARSATFRIKIPGGGGN
jgi:PKD repeat protein